MKLPIRYLLLLLFCVSFPSALFSQNLLKKQIGDTLTHVLNQELRIGNVMVKKFELKKKKIVIRTNNALVNYPFREETLVSVYDAIRGVLPTEYKNYSINCFTGRHEIESLIPNYFREKHIDSKRKFKVSKPSSPLLKRVSRPNTISKGLQDRHLALWQSHGYYYSQDKSRWEWQRARLNQTVEDLYTTSYVLPFLVPMLENAGATVLMPRERDFQTEEVVVDNDTVRFSSQYSECNGNHNWELGKEAGFAHLKDFYLHGENPFNMGTYRMIQTEKNEAEISFVEWLPEIPKTGNYAVYVSYKTLPESVSGARYEVYHKGGKTVFEVNQTMYGGTWLYLGNFDFEKGKKNTGKVVLSNFSKEKDKIVTADAVRFGGGMGNIARQPYKKDSIVTSKRTISLKKKQKVEYTASPAPFYTPEISSYPRFTEAARYWLQWAGVSDSIYSKSKGLNDYTDDFQSRGFWVNYVAGGSKVIPKEEGLNVPIELALAFHSDAGVTVNDSIIGTLGICMTQNAEKKEFYPNNVSRLAGRDLTDIIQTQIVNDIRMLYAPEWTRRGTWDKSYSEARVPEVPTMLLEILSHQNFADMRYGLDPRFKFAVSRAIYKGVLKYLKSVYGGKYCVQPLPVESFSSSFVSQDEIELSWQPVLDPLEPTAKAADFILYTRIDDGGFDNGVLVKENKIKLKIEEDKIYSFKVTAANKGGESFPSEILSACRNSKNSSEVLIVNCFDRISAPESFMSDSTYAGFLNREDAGMPYLYDIAFTGEQYEFTRNKPWTDNDSPGHGSSHANYETMLIAGNSFDYPFLHGKAIKDAGYSFLSCSKESVIKGEVLLSNYKIVDIILGKQKETFIGNRKKEGAFKIFPLDLQNKIRTFCEDGGGLLLSGAYIASELFEDLEDEEGKSFVENVLRCKFRTKKAAVTGKLKIVESPLSFFEKDSLSYYNEPNSISYYIESPDAIEPIDKDGYTICRYAENNLSAGIACKSKTNRLCLFGFPFETIKEEQARNKLMNSILNFLSKTETN